MAEDIFGSKGNVSLLEKYNFEKGNFTILGIRSPSTEDKLKKLGHFYSDDIKLLNKLKKEWIKEDLSLFYSCIYNYTIFVFQSGVEKARFEISSGHGCDSVLTKNGQYYFNPLKLIKYMDKYKKPRLEEKKFNTVQDGRNYIKKLNTRKNILKFSRPEWLIYDGEFDFYAKCGKKKFHSSLIPRCIYNIKEQIIEKVPDGVFNLSYAGFSDNKVLIKMKCNKELYNKFDLYKTNSAWRDYSPSLKVYLKK